MPESIPIPDGLTVNDVLDAIEAWDTPGVCPSTRWVRSWVTSAMRLSIANDRPVKRRDMAMLHLPTYTADQYARLEQMSDERRDAAEDAMDERLGLAAVIDEDMSDAWADAVDTFLANGDGPVAA